MTGHGNRHARLDVLTCDQAVTILGCHVSNVAKLVAKGQLVSRGRDAERTRLFTSTV